MNRTEFLRLSVFAAAAVSFPLLYSCNSNSNKNEIGKPEFLSSLFDQETITKVGKEYLEKTSSENDSDKLIELLAENNPIINSSDEKAIHEFLAEKIKADFENENVVMLKGWVLSVTEARQCALFSLLK